MAEMAKVLYIVVVDEEGKREKGKESFRYTRHVLQSTLQLMGCKPRHAFKISQRAFELIRNENTSDVTLPEGTEVSRILLRQHSDFRSAGNFQAKVERYLGSENGYNRKDVPFELYKRRTTVIVGRETFLDVVCVALSEYKYVGSHQRADLLLACRIREKKESVTVLLCGTSGCGKSTLSSLLASRLGITTVVSTDSIRHMMRSFADEKQNPLLWASTYHAGECLDPLAVAEAKAKKKAKKSAGVSYLNLRDEGLDGFASGKSDIRADEGSGCTELISAKQMAIEGFKAQSEMVIDSLDQLITAWEERKESVVVEGVHLSLSFVMGLMKKHPSIVPFMIYITNEEKHLERFAVRAKYMTLDPAKNKYVKYIRNIRTIQEYLCKRADKHLVPKINNTNVDKSVAAIHATVFGCLRRRGTGEPLYDSARNTVAVIDEEYRNQFAANSLSSKGMFQLIQRKGSSRQLMALVGTDGLVANTWSVDPTDRNGHPLADEKAENGMVNAMYGPSQLDKAETVNLQFGFYGISVRRNDGTSRAGSVDESRADGTDTGSRYLSSCCSSPRMSDGTFKEPKEDNSVYGSDEEIDDPHEPASDEYSDYGAEIDHDEVGSVDELSTKSDEEYDDLAMEDMQKNGYWADFEEEFRVKVVPVSGDEPTTKKGDKYHKNLDLFSRRTNEVPQPPLRYSPRAERKERHAQAPTSGNVKMKKRSHSIPAFGTQTSVMGDP